MSGKFTAFGLIYVSETALDRILQCTNSKLSWQEYCTGSIYCLLSICCSLLDHFYKKFSNN